MIKTFSLTALLLCSLLLSACSIDLSQSTLPTPLSTGSVESAPSSTPGAQATLSSPTQNAPGNPQISQLPVTWADLNLTGKLIYVAGVAKDNDLFLDVQSLDLTTGTVTTTFQAPSQGWVDSVAASPDGKELVLSYAPPASDPRGGQETLYIMPADGSQLAQPLFTPEDPKDQNYEPVWSPDGKYVYFAHFNYMAANSLAIMRVAFPGGTPEKILDNSYWPRVSPDSSRLVYVTADQQTGVNHLFVAAADGTQPHQLPLSGPYIPSVIDVPMLSPDGQSILFSSPDPSQSSILKWLDTILVVPAMPAADGSIPSDWFSVPVSGGVLKQLTHIHSLALYGNYSPDSRFIASFTSNGIFVMNPDGTGVTVVVKDTGGAPGSVNWLP